MGKRTIKSITNKIIKTKRQIKKLAIKKRQERKIHLIQLGTLFNIMELLDESQEVMLGFLEKYKKLSYQQKQEYFLIGEKILSEREAKTYDDDLDERKKMFFLMIRKAALLEKLKIHLEDSKIILGYLNTFSQLSLEEKKSLEERGKEIFTDKPVRDTIISDEEKMKILKESIIKNINITKLLKDEFNTTIHNIKRSQLALIEEKIRSRI
ncbi:hypothetical protein [uncultured Fusobacterium sp.]|jgi:hypothetical protein|uniref:hypothetical protein n=1 Tax=uncultured Fusobacterium sp. TaxID=159267 RepID=UPI0015A50C16|nr:hypothetical protein [uncultured Fusobacterium sp.]